MNRHFGKVIKGGLIALGLATASIMVLLIKSSDDDEDTCTDADETEIIDISGK